MKRDFQDAVSLVLSARIEGGYVNDPLDPGKETIYGITAANWKRAEDLGLVAVKLVKDRNRSEALVVYRAFFWDAYRCSELPYPLALAFFDTVVNHTPVWSIRALQRAVGADVDGGIGGNTLAAAKNMPLIGTAELPGSVPRLLDIRMQHYLGRSPLGETPVSFEVEEHFELGWCRRLMTILHAAILVAFEKEGV
jgi:lysozyme family protein